MSLLREQHLYNHLKNCSQMRKGAFACEVGLHLDKLLSGCMATMGYSSCYVSAWAQLIDGPFCTKFHNEQQLTARLTASESMVTGHEE